MSNPETQSDPNLRPSVSVVIPAHNEETVISRCLKGLMQGADPGELEIIVVCNGCKDQTAQIARSFGPGVKVIETEIPSKVNALNLGDQAARFFPRFYVDADVAISIHSIRKVAAALRDGHLVAAPSLRVDVRESSLGVKMFYSVWTNHPYIKKIIGSGVYALSIEGRSRFETFPNITADDEYVRRLFTDEERITLGDAEFTVSAPRKIRDLIKIKTRARRGNMELEMKFPARVVKSTGGLSRLALTLMCRPWLWPAVPVYFFVQTAALIQAKRTISKSGPGYWERDNSSRVAGKEP